MNFLKKLFNIPVKEDKEIQKQDVKLSLDDLFVHNFVEKGGKFLYSVKKQEVVDNLQRVISENNWKEIYLLDKSLAVLFKKTIKTGYTLNVLPDAIEDLYTVKSKDTLKYKFSTKDVEDYGTIILDIQKKVESPVIIELLSDDEIVKKLYIEASQKIEFNLLEPKKYTIRAIIDDNKNRVWDTGNYLQKQQPERIVYFSEDIFVHVRSDRTLGSCSALESDLVLCNDRR